MTRSSFFFVPSTRRFLVPPSPSEWPLEPLKYGYNPNDLEPRTRYDAQPEWNLVFITMESQAPPWRDPEEFHAVKHSALLFSILSYVVLYRHRNYL